MNYEVMKSIMDIIHESLQKNHVIMKYDCLFSWVCEDKYKLCMLKFFLL